MLSRAYKMARMDLNWQSVEAPCGTFNFASYDGLLAEMEEVGVRPYWILDYSNSCYEPPSGGSGCNTAACIAGYGRFAAAVASHFKGHNIVFESVNELSSLTLLACISKMHHPSASDTPRFARTPLRRSVNEPNGMVRNAPSLVCTLLACIAKMHLASASDTLRFARTPLNRGTTMRATLRRWMLQRGPPLLRSGRRGLALRLRASISLT